MAREKGYARPAGERVYSPAREDNWDLRWPQSIRIYSKMAREDSQTKSVLLAVTQPITRTPWRLEANGADPEVVRKIAEDLNLPVKGEELSAPIAKNPRKVSWSHHLKRALRWQLIYGHAYFELVWDDASETEDGLTHLRKIAPRHPDTIMKIDVAEDGGLEAITQKHIGGRQKPAKIPVQDLLVYRADDDHDDWIGESMLRAAYKHWRLKDEFLRLEQIVLDRNGMGVAVMKTRSEPSSQERSDAERVVSEVRTGDSGGVVIDMDESFSIEGVKGQLASPRQAIAYHDAQIARTALAHALNLDGGGGSYALAEVQMDLFFQALNDRAQEIADTANQYLVRKMVYNLTGDEHGPFPVIAFDRIEARRSLSANDLATLKNAGLIFADPATDSHIRRIYELPPALPPEKWEEARSQASVTPAVLTDVIRRLQAADATPELSGQIIHALLPTLQGTGPRGHPQRGGANEEPEVLGQGVG